MFAEEIKKILLDKKTLSDISPEELWAIYENKKNTREVFYAVQEEVIKRIVYREKDK